MLHRTALFFATTTLFACMTKSPPAAPEADGAALAPAASESRPREAPAEGAVRHADDGASASTPAAAGGQCRLTVSHTEGCTATEIEALIAPARQRIEECAGPRGGKVVVRLRDANGKLSFDLEPNASLDPTERSCILDALSTIPNGDASLRVNGEPRANGFTSLITLEW